MRSSAAIWRLVLGAALRLHLRREVGACAGLPKTMLLVDELPAFGNFEPLNIAVIQGRQKGILPMYLYQSRQQVQRVFGAEILNTWESTATLKVFTQINTPEYAQFVSDLAGLTPRLVQQKNVATAPENGGGMLSWEKQPLLPADTLRDLRHGEMVAVGSMSRAYVFKSHMPMWFRHPMLKARYERSQKLHPFSLPNCTELEDQPARLPLVEAQPVLLLEGPKSQGTWGA